MTNMNRDIATIEKNVKEDVLVKLTSFNKKVYVDLRVWIKPIPGTGEELKPTRKGITLWIGRVPDLIEALEKARKAYKDAKSK
jgi:hypothetical protein